MPNRPGHQIVLTPYPFLQPCLSIYGHSVRTPFFHGRSPKSGPLLTWFPPSEKIPRPPSVKKFHPLTGTITLTNADGQRVPFPSLRPHFSQRRVLSKITDQERFTPARGVSTPKEISCCCSNSTCTWVQIRKPPIFDFLFETVCKSSPNLHEFFLPI